MGGKSASRERQLGSGDSFFIQHIKEVVIDHQNGIFEGTNNLVGPSPANARGFHHQASQRVCVINGPILGWNRRLRALA